VPPLAQSYCCLRERATGLVADDVAAATCCWMDAALRRNRDLNHESGLPESRGDSGVTTPQTSENTDCP